MIPDPTGWLIDGVGDAAERVAVGGFEGIVGSLNTWILDAVVWIAGAVFRFFVEATDPNVEAEWFAGANGPYVTTATVGATLLVAFVFAGITQGVLAGDVAGMLRQMALHVPSSVLAMVGIIGVTQALIALTDALSRAVLQHFDTDVGRFTDALGSVGGLSGGTGPTFVILLLGLVAVVAGILLVLELVVRSALIYIVVAIAPLAFAAQVWPALRGVGRKLLEVLAALVVSKLVIAVALAVAAAGVGGVPSGRSSTLVSPELAGAPGGGSVTSAVGILLAAVAGFGVAAFSPLLITKLLPLTEAAVVAQGVRGGPLRAGQSAMSMTYSGRTMSQRLGRVAAGPVSAGAGGSSMLSAGGAAGVAAAPVAAAASVAATGTRAAAGVAKRTAEVAAPEPRGSQGRGEGDVGRAR